MRKLLFLMLMAIVFNGMAFAGDNENHHDAITKLATGMYNVVTSPLEVSDNMAYSARKRGLFESLTYGLVKGVVGGFKKFGQGLYEICTYPIKDKEEKEPEILVDPDFFGERIIEKDQNNKTK